MTRSIASRIRVPTTEISSDVRQPARFEKKTNTPASPLVRRRSSSLAAGDEPDDEGGAHDGEDDPARASEQQASDDPAHDRAADAHEDRHRDTHRVGPGDDEARKGTDNQPTEDDPDDEQNHGFSLVLGTRLTRQRRCSCRQILGGDGFDAISRLEPEDPT